MWRHYYFLVHPNIDITLDHGSKVKFCCYVPRIRPAPTAVFWKFNNEEVEVEATFQVIDAVHEVCSARANVTYDVSDGQLASAQCVVRAGGQEWSQDVEGGLYYDFMAWKPGGSGFTS